jgi:hypothetical protein
MKSREYGKIWKHAHRINQIAIRSAKKCREDGCRLCPLNVANMCSLEVVAKLEKQVTRYRPVPAPLPGVPEPGVRELFEELEVKPRRKARV